MNGAPPWSPFARPMLVGGGGAAPAPEGKSYDFDGVDDYVLANGAAALIDFGNTEHSVSIWAKVPPTSASLSALWSFTNSGAATTRYWLAISASGAINLYGWGDSSGSYPIGTGGNPVVIGAGLDDGAWHHIVVTYDGSTRIHVYVDGGTPTVVNLSAGALTSDTMAFGARRLSGATSYAADCLIHQASLYTSELTAAQVAAVYNNNRPVNELTLTPAPRHYYRFGNGDVLFPTLKDYGSGGADGTAYNMTISSIVDGYPAGMSYLFDGVQDYIQADAVVSSGGNFDWQDEPQTVSVWFKTTSTAQQALWSFGHSSSSVKYYYLQIQGASGGSPAYFKAIGSATSTAGLFGKADATSSPNGATKEVWVNSTDPNGIDPTDGEWHNIVITFSGQASTAEAVKLYADGNYVGFSKSRSSDLDVSDFSIGVFRYDGASDLEQYFSGNISQVSMWTSALSASDITALYAAGNMPDPRSLPTPPQHLYRFGAGDNSFPTLIDYGSEGDNGTAVNLAASDVKDDSPP